MNLTNFRDAQFFSIVDSRFDMITRDIFRMYFYYIVFISIIDVCKCIPRF